MDLTVQGVDLKESNEARWEEGRERGEGSKEGQRVIRGEEVIKRGGPPYCLCRWTSRLYQERSMGRSFTGVRHRSSYIPFQGPPGILARTCNEQGSYRRARRS
mgnify:CR=1 FL=1